MVDLFIEWYVFEIPAKIKKIWSNYVWFFAKFFSLAELTRDFFAPWKGLTFQREKRGFEIGDMLSATFGNMISRLFGAMIRLFFIACGLVVEAASAVFCLVAYVLWIGLAPLTFFCLSRAIYLLFIS
jgi:hypothetical protein